MERTAKCLVGTIMAGSLLVAAAQAETWSLELKRQESKAASFDSTLRLYWTNSQDFFQQLAADQEQITPVDGGPSTEAFKRIVRKEPSYQARHPFRGVAKLGSQEYAFALDAVPPKPDPKKAKPKEEKSKAAPQAPKHKSLLSEMAESLFGTSDSEESEQPQIDVYNRLYFDFNHNGDLTDDKVVEGLHHKSSVTIVLGDFRDLIFRGLTLRSTSTTRSWIIPLSLAATSTRRRSTAMCRCRSTRPFGVKATSFWGAKNTTLP